MIVEFANWDTPVPAEISFELTLFCHFVADVCKVEWLDLVRDVIEDIGVFGTGADDEAVLFLWSRWHGVCGWCWCSLSAGCVFATDFTVLLSVLDLAVSTTIVCGHTAHALFGGCFAASRIGTNASRHGIRERKRCKGLIRRETTPVTQRKNCVGLWLFVGFVKHRLCWLFLYIFYVYF